MGEESVFYTAKDLMKKMALGRDSVYELLNSSDTPFPVFRFGKQFRVPKVPFDIWAFSEGMSVADSA